MLSATLASTARRWRALVKTRPAAGLSAACRWKTGTLVSTAWRQSLRQVVQGFPSSAFCCIQIGVKNADRRAGEDQATVIIALVVLAIFTLALVVLCLRRRIVR